MNLCESKYVQGISCVKKLWLSCFKKREGIYNNFLDEAKTKIIDLARTYFGDNYVLINQDAIYKNMLDETNKYVENKSSVICNAQFIFDDNSCSIDILKNNDDGVEIYNVKASTSIYEEYIDEISYQIWILKKCGLKIKKASILYVNSQYIKNGDLNVKEFFNIEEITSYNLNNVEENIDSFKKIINQDKEPNIDLSMACSNCPFFKYCTKELPSPNVFDLGSTTFSKKIDFYKKGHISYVDLLKYEKSLNAKATNQIKAYFKDKSQSKPIINKEIIATFFRKIKYPLYFLDFEAYQDLVPKIDGTKPYQQICFQYSLHYFLEENGELFHKGFLSDNYDNPMYDLCKHLCEDIPMNSCILVYNSIFEKMRLKEMSELYSKYKDHLLNISNNIIDLADIFKSQSYYTKEMKGSYTLKNVLLSLFPIDHNLDYSNLEKVHNGVEVSNAFLSLKELPKEEQNKLRQNMIKYCELDSYAMFKVYETLRITNKKNEIFADTTEEILEYEKFEEKTNELNNSINLKQTNKYFESSTKPKVKSIEDIKAKYSNINFNNLNENTPKLLLGGDFIYDQYLEVFGSNWDYSAPIAQWCRAVEGELRSKIYSLLDSQKIKIEISEESVKLTNKVLKVKPDLGFYSTMKDFGLTESIFNNYIKNNYINLTLYDFKLLVDYIYKIVPYRNNSSHNDNKIHYLKIDADECKDYIVPVKKILEILSHLEKR